MHKQLPPSPSSPPPLHKQLPPSLPPSSSPVGSTMMTCRCMGEEWGTHVVSASCQRCTRSTAHCLGIKRVRADLLHTPLVCTCKAQEQRTRMLHAGLYDFFSLPPFSFQDHDARCCVWPPGHSISGIGGHPCPLGEIQPFL